MGEIDGLIKEVHEAKYSALSNSCLRKSHRIIKEVRKLGHKANLMVCISHPEHSALFGWPLYTLHFYALVDGRKVDVAFDPELEQRRMRNEDVEMTKGIVIPWV